MGFTHAVHFENSIHRGAVAPGDLEQSFAAFDLMADHLGRLLLGLAPSDFNDRLHRRIHWHLNSVAGRNGSSLRAQGRIPSQELVLRQACAFRKSQ
jgi:hypothetical protein